MDTEINFVVTVGFTTKVDHQTASKISPRDFRSCLMIDLGRETDGNNEKCLGVHFALCMIMQNSMRRKASELAKLQMNTVTAVCWLFFFFAHPDFRGAVHVQRAGTGLALIRTAAILYPTVRLWFGTGPTSPTHGNSRSLPILKIQLFEVERLILLFKVKVSGQSYPKVRELLVELAISSFPDHRKQRRRYRSFA